MRSALAPTMMAGLALLSCCKDPKNKGDEGNFSPFQRSVAPESLALEARMNATFSDILGQFDLDGDSEIGGEDLGHLDQCLADGATVSEHPECDLDADGVIDNRDRLLFLRLFGEKQPIDDAQTQGVADLLAAYGDGSLPARGLADVFPDLDGDGERGGADFTLAASILRDAPRTTLDFNGDGSLDRGDTYELLSRVYAGFFGGDAPDVDLNGDGQLDDSDAAIVEVAVAFTMHILPGFLDVNQDGKVDIDDYCVRAAHPFVPNFLGAVMTSAAADAAFQQSPPSVLICREDGRSIHRFEPRRDSRIVLRVVPDNLYLRAVAAVPEGYLPINAAEIEDASQLYVISTAAGDIPVEAVDFPWIRGTHDPEEDQVGVVLGSRTFEDGDFLLLPGVAVPLRDLTLLKSGGFSPVDKVKAQAKIHEAQLSPTDLVTLQGIRQTASTLDEDLERLISSDCPCDLPESERILLMRRIDMTLDCLRVSERLAEIWLEAAVLKSQNAAELHVYSSGTSAAMWGRYSQSVWQAEVAKTAILLSETATNCVVDGPYKALYDSILQLTSEIIADQGQDNWLQVGDDRREFIAGQLRDQILPQLMDQGVGVTAEWLGSRNADEALSDAIGFIQKHRNMPADGKISSFVRELRGADQPGGVVDPRIVFTLAAIAVDGMVESMKGMAFNAYFQSVADAAHYQESLTDVAQHHAAYFTASTLRHRLANQRIALLDAFATAEEPCPFVERADAQACVDAYTSAVDAAQARWDEAQDAYQTGILASIADESEDSREEDCRVLGQPVLPFAAMVCGDNTEARVALQGRMERGELACDAPTDAVDGPARALEDLQDAQRSLNAECPLEAQLDSTLPAGSVIAQLDALRETLLQAKSDFDAALAQAAAERDTCLHTLGALEPCSHAARFQADPLGYVQECLDCLSVPTPPCDPVDDLQLVVGDLPPLVYRRDIEIVLEPAVGGLPPYGYTVSGLPPGLSFDPATRIVSGAPVRHGLFEVTYEVIDAAQSVKPAFLTFDVAPVLVVDIGGTCPTYDASVLDSLRAFGNVGFGEEEVDIPGAEHLVVGDDSSVFSCPPDPSDPVDGVFAWRKTVTWQSQTVYVPFCEVAGTPAYGPLYQSFQVAASGGALTFDSGFTGATVDCCSNYCPGTCTFQGGLTREQCCAANPSCYCSWTNRFIDSNAQSFWQQYTHWRFSFANLQVFETSWSVVPPELAATHWVWCTDQRLCASPLDCTDPSFVVNFVHQHAAIVFVPTLEQQILGR